MPPLPAPRFTPILASESVGLGPDRELQAGGQAGSLGLRAGQKQVRGRVSHGFPAGSQVHRRPRQPQQRSEGQRGARQVEWGDRPPSGQLPAIPGSLAGRSSGVGSRHLPGSHGLWGRGDAVHKARQVCVRLWGTGHVCVQGSRKTGLCDFNPGCFLPVRGSSSSYSHGRIEAGEGGAS